MDNKETVGFTRRGFLKTGAAAAAGFMILPRHVLGGTGFIAPSDRLNLGYIGTGRPSFDVEK
ncbi:twin-arginine translocation signal domain-containing protein [Parapedobacter sp. 10938]|uniref:twin-arginine translocation signal domain-containing protein n=1 Tax=Parapedobacter flavus TaxID=3110225 RepID=UPI002DB7F876|nr:twin-arginine translocation signal domain-containing protein [Parapedobacter sp. 10938]MEC3878395.1 twin-arginine translocation signal domain-containing protein [Parapedobacter sp. 10938]